MSTPSDSLALVDNSPGPSTARVVLEKSVVYLVLVFNQLVFGGYSVVSKIALNDNVDPIIFAFYRDVIATPLLLLLAWKVEGLPLPKGEDWTGILLCGFFGIYGNQVFYILGVEYTNSINAALMQPSIPVFTTVLAIIIGIEVLRYKTLHGGLKVLGILSAVGGAVIVIAMGEEMAESESLIIGNLCLVTNCLCTAVWVLLQKNVLKKYPPITVNALSYAVGVGCLFMSVIGGQGHAERWILPVDAIWPLMYAAILSSFLCYTLQTWANKRTSPSIVTAFYPLQVVASAVLSIFAFGHILTAPEIIGACLVLLGLFFVVASRHQEEKWLKEHPEAALAANADRTDKVVSETSINGDSGVTDSSMSEKEGLLAASSASGVKKYNV